MKSLIVKNSKISRRDMLKLMGVGTGAAILAGCGTKATETAAPAKPTAIPPTAPPKEVTLRYQNHWTKETDAHYEGMNWLYEEFGKAYPNIHIENILIPDSTESFKKIMADCAAKHRK